MTTGLDWQAQVGRSWAKSYTLTDRSFSGLTQHLLERIAERAGISVLDVGCGAGELSLAVARQRPQSRVLGLDISTDLVDAAEERRGSQANVRFATGDAATWSEPGFYADLVVSRHGVMFFDDPVGAFTHLASLTTSVGSLVFSCFRHPMDNPWASGLAELLGQPPARDPAAPGPFAFADKDRVGKLLDQARWRDVNFEPVDFAYIAGAGEAPVDDALELFRRIGPAAPVLRSLEGASRVEAEQRIREWLRGFRSDQLVAFPAAAWIVTARRG